MDNAVHESQASVISADLLKAWDRSEHKINGWTREKAREALDRYRKFLLLIAKNPSLSFAPTRDIDEMWHLHMLSPRTYQQDCARLFGEVLDHDGGFGKEAGELPILKAVFERTAHMWEESYGESYVADTSVSMTNCWHNCVSRCWHACSSKTDHQLDQAGAMTDR